MTEQPADPTAMIEVWARMLCAADVHVNGGDHPTWQQLSTSPGRGQDAYRKAARWLLPRLTVATRPAVGEQAATQPATDVLTDSERQFLTFALELAADQMASRGAEFDDEDDAALARLRRMAVEDES